jgi:hypothetical protein
MKDEFCARLVQFCDFNELSNFADPEMPVESLQEISLYGLLAMVNLSYMNVQA